jgi:hypothetical protein
MPGTLLWSCWDVLPVLTGPGLLLAGPDVVPEPDVVVELVPEPLPDGSFTDGPDLLPGSPGAPGLEMPPVPGGFC